MTARGTAIAVLAGASAAAIGFACGAPKRRAPPPPTLPTAGSPGDDGTGVLARWSVSSPEPGADLAGAPAPRAPALVAPDAGPTGGASYGGSRYAGYAFSADYASAWASLPSVAEFDGYYVDQSASHGAIEGVVTWPKPPSAAALAPCDAAAGNDSLRLGEGGTVANAVVYLDDIGHGPRSAPPIAVGGVLERARCRFRPHVQIAAPIGVALRVTNSEATARTVTGRLLDGKSLGGEVFTAAIPHRGMVERIGLMVAGFYQVAVDTDEGVPAWVVVPRHPYYTITDDAGRFRIDSIPAGTYSLVVWHAPVVTGVGADGAATATHPVSVRKRVKVTADKTGRANVALPATR